MKITFLLPLVLVFIVAVNSQSVSYWQQLVPLPSGLKNQGGYTYLKASTMLSLFGKPCALTPNCKTVTAPTLASQIQTRKIGKFTFTGMKKVLDALSRALNRVAKENPSLYNALGSSGMLCCRAIRGSSTTFSNHAWGAAIDFNIGGKLDPRGDGKTQRGLLALWPYMKREGFYWAGGYSGSSEDAMHFEIANEVMLNWGRSGDWGSCTTTGGVGGRCIDVSQCNGQTQANRCPGPSNIKCCYSAPPKKYKCVTATKLNVRSGPCTTHSILTTVQKNEALEVLSSTIRSGCSNNWVNVRVRRNGVAGHVSTSYVKDCVPSGANEFNNTLIDEPVNGTFFAEDDEGFDYESVEPPEEVSMSSIVTPFLAVPLFFVIHLVNRYVF